MLYKNNLVSSSDSELYHANGVAENGSYDALNRPTGATGGLPLQPGHTPLVRASVSELRPAIVGGAMGGCGMRGNMKHFGFSNKMLNATL